MVMGVVVRMVMAAETCRVANKVEVQRKIYGFFKPNTQLLYVTFQETETPLATTATTIATTSTTTVTTTTTPVSTVSTGVWELCLRLHYFPTAVSEGITGIACCTAAQLAEIVLLIIGAYS